MTPRRIVITLMLGIPLLAALAWREPAAAQQTFSIAFPKKAGVPNSCMTEEPGGSGGTLLRCRIELPADVPAHLFIRGVYFQCRPDVSQACRNTQECPGNGAVCDRHVNAVVPVDFNISRPGSRSVEWWGWTNDSEDATLHFDVRIGP